jgi:outer membrane protein
MVRTGHAGKANPAIFSKPSPPSVLHLRSMPWKTGCRRKAGRCAAAFALLTVGAAAACAQWPAGFAVVDLQAAMIGTKDGKKAADELAATVNPRRKEFEQRQQELDQLRAQLQDGKLDDEKKAALAGDIDIKAKRLERDTKAAQDELEGEEQKFADRFGPKLVAIVKKYAAEHGLIVVFDKSNDSSPVVYAGQEADITQAVIDAYDQAPPEAAPAASTADSPPKSKPAPKPAAPSKPQ